MYHQHTHHLTGTAQFCSKLDDGIQSELFWDQHQMLLTRRQTLQSSAKAGIDSTKVGIHVSLQKAMFPLSCGLGSVAAFVCAHDHMRSLVWASLVTVTEWPCLMLVFSEMILFCGALCPSCYFKVNTQLTPEGLCLFFVKGNN